MKEYFEIWSVVYKAFAIFGAILFGLAAMKTFIGIEIGYSLLAMLLLPLVIMGCRRVKLKWAERHGEESK